MTAMPIEDHLKGEVPPWNLEGNRKEMETLDFAMKTTLQ